MAKLCPACVGYCGLVKMSDEQLTPAEGTKAATAQAGATGSSRQLSHQKSNADAALDLLHSSQAFPHLDLVDAPKGMSYAHNSAANEPRPVTAALVTVDDRLDQLELKLRSLRCAGPASWFTCGPSAVRFEAGEPGGCALNQCQVGCR